MKKINVSDELLKDLIETSLRKSAYAQEDTVARILIDKAVRNLFALFKEVTK